MLVKKLAVAAVLVLGATSLASAQAGSPGAMSYGSGCYGCSQTTGSGRGVSGRGLFDFAGQGAGSGVYDYAGQGSPVAGEIAHTGDNYDYFRSDGPDRGNSIESQR